MVQDDDKEISLTPEQIEVMETNKRNSTIIANMVAHFRFELADQFDEEYRKRYGIIPQGKSFDTIEALTNDLTQIWFNSYINSIINTGRD